MSSKTKKVPKEKRLEAAELADQLQDKIDALGETMEFYRSLQRAHGQLIEASIRGTNLDNEMSNAKTLLDQSSSLS